MTSDRSPLDELEELLHRQVHPSFLQNGRVGSQAFRPTPKDDGLLSVSRGSLTSAQDAYLLYTDDRGLESAGVWSVSVGECSAVNLQAFSAPLVEPIADPAHALIDFKPFATRVIERISKRLAAFARRRGCQYPTHDSPEPAAE